ncbi:MAG: FadR family transcriptional regulator, partial [Chloroflexi bacterium]|nr:FadR family transcriptional regulator [Chloroflexota bacterium]
MPRRITATKRKKRNTRLYEEVMVQLADLIRDGEFKPGDRLPAERVLADRLRVSRATLREALRVMELQSLVVSRPGAGTFIVEQSAESLVQTLKQLALQDIFELRMILDPAIASLAALRASAKDIAKLDSILQQQERQIQRGKTGADADTHFHSALAEATHNRALIRLGNALVAILAPSRNAHLQSPQRAGTSLISHRSILNAIKAHSPRRAQEAMVEHVRAVDISLTESDLKLG